MGETKGFLFFIGNIFGEKKIGYQFTNRKTGKATKFGLITNSASKIMQKKTGSWYKVQQEPAMLLHSLLASIHVFCIAAHSYMASTHDQLGYHSYCCIMNFELLNLCNIVFELLSL